MSCTCAPALLALRHEVDAAYPDRDQASDGCCASSAHSRQNPTSDHEPGTDGTAKGLARALDIDEDLTPHGPGPDDLTGLLFHLYGATAADADPRVKMLIYERWIYYPHDGTRARGSYPYDGVNPHDKHLHVSIFDWAVNITTRWLPQPATEDDPMVFAVKADADEPHKKALAYVGGKWLRLSDGVAGDSAVVWISNADFDKLDAKYDPETI